MAERTASSLRKRMRRWEEPGGVRFLTFSCHRRSPLLRNPAIADLFSQTLSATRRTYGFELFAWVVMPEHVHLLLRPGPDAPLGAALRSIKTSVAKRVVARWRELGAPIVETLRTGRGDVRFWQKGGGLDRTVRDEREFCREVWYIHTNPVKRGLVGRAEDWRWSSRRWWMGKREGEVECDPPPGDRRVWEAWRGYK